jgi:hypothetical protein
MQFTSALHPILRDSARIALWRLPAPSPTTGNYRQLIFASIFLALMMAFADRYTAGFDSEFDFYGINAIVTATVLIVAYFLFVFRKRQTILSTSRALIIISLFLLVSPLVVSIPKVMEFVPENLKQVYPFGFGLVSNWLPATAFFAFLIWASGCFKQILDDRNIIRFSGMKALGILLGGQIVLMAMPYTPLFKADDFSYRTANAWEIARIYFASTSAPDDSRSNAYEIGRTQIEIAQPSMVVQALEKLGERRDGVKNIWG